MQRRGYTIDEVNAYYDSLQKWAEPVHSMDPLIEFFSEIKSIESESEEPLTEEYDAVLSSFKAVNSVILPFFNLNRRIMTQIHRMEDWGKISLKKTGYPLLPLNTIYETLRSIPIYKREAILRHCSFSYNDLTRLLIDLEEDHRPEVISILGDSNDVCIISDICQEYGIVEPDPVPTWADSAKIVDITAALERLNLSPEQLNTDDDPSNYRFTRDGLLSIVVEFYKPLIKFIDVVDKGSAIYTDRELFLFASILKRPDGKHFVSIYKGHLQREEEKAIQNPSASSLPPEQGRQPDAISESPIPNEGGEQHPEAESTNDIDTFKVPDDIFKIEGHFPIDTKNADAHFRTKPEIEKLGGKKFAELIDCITASGYIASKDKQLLTYILTGRCKPENYNKDDALEWIDSGYGYELFYVIKYIVGHQKKYEKARVLFRGPQWLGKGAFKDQADYANIDFRKALHAIYPDVCKIKQHIETAGKPINRSEWAFIQENPYKQ